MKIMHVVLMALCLVLGFAKGFTISKPAAAATVTTPGLHYTVLTVCGAPVWIIQRGETKAIQGSFKTWKDQGLGWMLFEQSAVILTVELSYVFEGKCA